MYYGPTVGVRVSERDLVDLCVVAGIFSMRMEGRVRAAFKLASFAQRVAFATISRRVLSRRVLAGRIPGKQPSKVRMCIAVIRTRRREHSIENFLIKL